MTTFATTKFDDINDPTRPALESEVENKGITYIVKRVSWIPLSVLLKREEPDMDGYDDMLLKRHPERPAVFWVMWVMKK